MTFERFEEKFNELDFSDKLNIYNNYCVEYRGSDDEIFTFDEEFFEIFFTNPIDAARAVFFGKIESWNDEYIRFDGYGNLESLSEYEAEGEIAYDLDSIFEHEDCWKDYIEEDEEDEEEE
jgi:hypothetical protein